jgi:diphthamide biosynthesis enzyme Dph1/Dph2-like protein
VFDRASVNADAVVSALKSAQRPLLVFCDVEYEHAIDEIRSSLPSQDDTADQVSFARFQTVMLPKPQSAEPTGLVSFSGRAYTPLPSSSTSPAIFFLGAITSSFLTHVQYSHPSAQVQCCDPTTGKMVLVRQPALGKRYAAVQKCRDAQAIGLVIGTLDVGTSCFFIWFFMHVMNLLALGRAVLVSQEP